MNNKLFLAFLSIIATSFAHAENVDLLNGAGEFKSLTALDEGWILDNDMESPDGEALSCGEISLVSTDAGQVLRLAPNGNTDCQPWELQAKYNVTLKEGVRYMVVMEYNKFPGGAEMVLIDNVNYSDVFVSTGMEDWTTSTPSSISIIQVSEYDWDVAIQINAGGLGDNVEISAIYIYEDPIIEDPPPPSSDLPASSDNTKFAFNQVGFTTHDYKELAVIDGSSEDVEFLDKAGKVVLKVTPATSGSSKIALIDFSEITEPGTYTARQGKITADAPIIIDRDPFGNLLNASLKFYYYQRASMDLEEKYAGKWKRKAGHPDTKVTVLSNDKDNGTTISAPKGWYDAGDYGKYIVNAGISTYTLLALYEHYPDFFKKRKWNIPADGKLPDLLAEIKYNLDWMLAMQREDGGVYNKLTTREHALFVMPHEDIAERVVIQPNTGAAYSFAAVMATAARIYKEFDPAYAKKMLNAAEKAYNWASTTGYGYIDFGVTTGDYPDGNSRDLAEMELYISTDGNEKYDFYSVFSGVPEWANVSGITGYEAIAQSIIPESKKQYAFYGLKHYGDSFVNSAKTGYGTPSPTFNWGANSFMANDGVLLLHIYYATGDKKYYEAALKALDYLLGKNDYYTSFVTGYGKKAPMHPHHRQSETDGIDDPIPGMLVGGPASPEYDNYEGKEEDYRGPVDGCLVIRPYDYFDDACSYASNEVTINWNAPLAYLVGAIKALNSGYAPSFAHENVKAYAAEHVLATTDDDTYEEPDSDNPTETDDSKEESKDKDDGKKDAITVNATPMIVISVQNRNLIVSGTKTASITLLDVQGHALKTYANVDGQISLASLPGGHYIARVRANGLSTTKRIILK